MQRAPFHYPTFHEFLNKTLPRILYVILQWRLIIQFTKKSTQNELVLGQILLPINFVSNITFAFTKNIVSGFET